MTWQSRPSSVYGYYDNASELGALFASPNNRDFLKLDASAYACCHGHLTHHSRVDGGDSFDMDGFEERFRETMWASWFGCPVYYASSLGLKDGQPTRPEEKWKRLTKFWAPEYFEYMIDTYVPSQFQVRTAATQMLAVDNGSFIEPYWIDNHGMKHGYYVSYRDNKWVPYEEHTVAMFVSKVEDLLKLLWSAGVRVMVNQAANLMHNWIRTHRWVSGSCHEKILFFQQSPNAYNQAVFRDKIERCFMLHSKVNLFDAVLLSPDDADEIQQACLTFSLLRGPFDFLSMRYKGHPPQDYLQDLDWIGVPIAPVEPTATGYQRITDRGVVKLNGLRMEFEQA